MRITYLAETDLGQIGFEDEAEGIDFKRAKKVIARETGSEEVEILDHITDKEPLYDEIIESWGVDVI